MSTQSFKVKSGLTLNPTDLTTLTSPQAGDLACDSNDSNKIKRYDAASASWTEVGSGASGDVDTLLVQDFDSASLSSFTQTGLALITVNPLDGRQSARLIHQPLVGAVQSFKETVSVSPKFRGVNMTASLLLRSSASQGNVTIQFRDETNSVDYPSQQLQTNSQEIASLVTNSTTTVSGFSNSVINSLKVGMSVTGSGVPTGTTIASINSTALTIVLSQAATASATVSLRFSDLPRTIQLGFQIPANCSSYSYTISALQEAGSPETYIDDVVLKNYWLGMSNQGQSEITYNTIESQNIFINSGSASVNIDMTNTVVAENKGIAGIISHSSGVITVLKKCNLSIDFIATQSAASFDMYPYIKRNGTTYAQNLAARGTSAGGYTEPVSANLIAEVGDTFTFGSGGVGVSNCKIMITAEAAVEKSFITNDLVPAKAVLGNTSLEIPSITGWQGYTPTFQGFGTPSNIEFEWRQVGENVEIRGKFTSGTTTAVEARVGLPAGLTSAGTSLIPSICAVGTSSQNDFYILIEPNITYLTLGDSTLANVTKANASSVVLTGSSISFFASIPCAGLSATEEVVVSGTQSALVQEADGHYQLNNFTYRTASTATNILYFNDGTLVANIGDHITKLSDSVNGDQFIATKSGTYSINFAIEIGTTAGSVYLVKNSTSSTVANILSSFYENGGNSVSNSSWTGYLNEGDILRFIKAGGLATFAASDYNVIDIAYQGSLKQLNVSSDQKITIPTSELRFTGSSSRGTADSGTRVKFDTLASIRGDAFTVTNDATGTMLTVTKKGILSVNANLVTASATYAQIIVAGRPMSAFDISGNGGSGSWDGTVNIGDTIYVVAGLNPNGNLAISFNAILQEQDIAVSVTNTLPQFSESDSSVRVDTANGYGSTGTRIRRFSNIRDNIGTDIQYNPLGDEAINGASFRIVTSGVYNISYTDTPDLAGQVIAISKNASSLTTAANLLPVSERLAISNSANGAQYAETVSVQPYLQAGDIIRAHTNGGANTINPSLCSFTISKVGKPNVTGVDVTPFVNVPQPDSQSIESLAGTSTFGSTNTGVPVFAISKDTSNGIIAIDSTAAAGTSFRALKSCRVNISSSAAAATVGSFHITKNATLLTSASVNGIVATQSVPAGTNGNVSTEIRLDTGDVLRIQRDSGGVNSNFSVILSAEALSDQILTAPETFSTDTASLAYSSTYTLSTLNTAPVGTYITFTYAINTNTRTQTSTRPTQTDADMNANGMLIYTRAYNAASTAAQPAAFAIQIGKGLKGKSLDLYKSAGKVTAGSLDVYNPGSTANKTGIELKEYSETTGILIIDAGYSQSSLITSHAFVFSDITNQTSGYLVINASKNPALTGLGFGSVVKAKYTSNSGQAVGTSATLLTMEDSVYDSNNAYTSGVYTVPENGTYIITANWVTAAVAISASTGSMSILIYVDGVLASNSFIRATGNTLAHLASITDQFVLRKGQTISIYGACSTATTMASGSFSITKFSVVKDS